MILFVFRFLLFSFLLILGESTSLSFLPLLVLGTWALCERFSFSSLSVAFLVLCSAFFAALSGKEWGGIFLFSFVTSLFFFFFRSFFARHRFAAYPLLSLLLGMSMGGFALLEGRSFTPFVHGSFWGEVGGYILLFWMIFAGVCTIEKAFSLSQRRIYPQRYRKPL